MITKLWKKENLTRDRQFLIVPSIHYVPIPKCSEASE